MRWLSMAPAVPTGHVETSDAASEQGKRQQQATGLWHCATAVADGTPIVDSAPQVQRGWVELCCEDQIRQQHWVMYCW
jgi:hypothetical protein